MDSTPTPTRPPVVWPEGKRFAFTVFDDTDGQTVHNTKAVYDLLYDLGFRTTKSVWPLRGSDAQECPGSTCEDPAYLGWALDLKQKGFEIGYHNATYHTSERETTRRGLERFRELFGHYPLSMANHCRCNEGIYRGDARLDGPGRVAYNVLTGFKNRQRYEGHIPESPLFWGDLCREKVRYVRNFVYDEVNTLKACPYMPYVDPSKPFVNAWFASSREATCRSTSSFFTLRE